MIFEKATAADLDEIGALYDAVCDWLEAHVNYPHWKKGVYPTRADAEESLEAGTLYVCRDGDVIAGTVKLNHIPEEGYAGVTFGTPDDYARILVFYTLAVRPDHLGRGVGRMMMEAGEKLAREQGCIALRLDAVKDNLPAERLYERCGFKLVATRSLGYEYAGIPLNDIYEKIL